MCFVLVDNNLINVEISILIEHVKHEKGDKFLFQKQNNLYLYHSLPDDVATSGDGGRGDINIYYLPQLVMSNKGKNIKLQFSYKDIEHLSYDEINSIMNTFVGIEVLIIFLYMMLEFIDVDNRNNTEPLNTFYEMLELGHFFEIPYSLNPNDNPLFADKRRVIVLNMVAHIIHINKYQNQRGYSSNYNKPYIGYSQSNVEDGLLNLLKTPVQSNEVFSSQRNKSLSEMWI